METNADYALKMKELRGKIASLDEELKNNGAFDSDIKKVQKNKDYLELIKNTIIVFKNMGRMFKGKITDSAELIQVQKNSFFYEEDNIETDGKLAPADIVLMIIYGVLIILTLTPWAELGGHEVSLTEILQGADILNSLGVDTGGGVYFFVLLGCFALLGCAVAYAVLIYNTYRKKETNLPYMTMLAIIIIWLVFWLCSVSWNSSFDGIMGYTSLSAELKGSAWIALILSIFASFIYSRSEEVNERLFGVSETTEEQERTLPVTNYYPWEDICFFSLTLTQNEQHISFTVQYQISKVMRRFYSGDNIWDTAKTEFAADIFLKTPMREYVITNCILAVQYGINKGETDRIVLDGKPLEINEINDIKIILKERKDPNGKKKDLHRVSVDSGMNSIELDSYRQQNNCKDAVCREQKLENGWLCRCGLVHRNDEKRCINCGTSVI